jgi:hypothetical protein
MTLELRRLQRITMLMLMTAALAACGGGGDDDEDDEDNAPEDEDASGLWTGTFTQAGSSRGFIVAAAPSGQFVGFVTGAGSSPPRLMLGTGTVTQNIFNATGTVIAPTGTTLPSGAVSAALTVSAGRVTTGVSMTGNYNGGGETATFSLNFDPKTLRGASLATLAGTYTQSGATATMTINSMGSATFATAAGCNGTGTFQIPDATLNLYSWTLDLGACGTNPAVTFSGLGALADALAGGTNNQLALWGANAARDRGFTFGGAK